MALPPSMGSGGAMSSGLSQTVRQASLGLSHGPGTIGPAARQSSQGLPQSQGSLGLASSGSLGTAQRQGSLGLSQSMGQGSMGLPYEPSPQDLQVSSAQLMLFSLMHTPPPTHTRGGCRATDLKRLSCGMRSSGAWGSCRSIALQACEFLRHVSTE